MIFHYAKLGYYEVEARNDEEVALKVEQIFNGDIYTMYVYQCKR